MDGTDDVDGVVMTEEAMLGLAEMEDADNKPDIVDADERVDGGRACSLNVADLGVEQKRRMESCTQRSMSISAKLSQSRISLAGQRSHRMTKVPGSYPDQRRFHAVPIHA